MGKPARSYAIRPTMCPYCGYVAGAATHCAEARAPWPGVYVMCAGCGKLGRLNEQMMVDRLSQREYWEMLMSRPVDEVVAVLRLQLSHRMLRGEHGSPKKDGGNA